MRFLRDIIVPVAVGLAVFAIFNTAVGSFKVYGLSMWPTVEDGEYILVNKAAYFFNEPHHGDIIVFHSPNSPSTDLIKRVIAVPTDNVEIRDKTVFVNNAPLVEPYIVEPPQYIYPIEEIPTDNYFVLGDNRNNSSDSHKGWTVPRQNIIGKAWITYWPPYRWRLIPHYTLNTDAQVVRSEKTCLITELLCPTR